ncbi:MAG TPA: HAD family phosphatase [Trebonia sp.]|nr:HAD family phosphatase [Trebonia sp.]
MTYRGLLLDFGGVVTTDPLAELSAFCAREGLPRDAFARVLHEAEGQAAYQAVEAGVISQRDFEVTIGRMLGLADRGLLKRALGGLRPRPEVLELVRRARSEEILVGLLSNSWGEGDYDPYGGYDLEALFDAVVISGDAEVRKPNLAIYLLAAGELGLQPQECVFVDDTAANLPPAETAGMATVLFTDQDTAIAEIRRLLGIR